MDPKTETQVPHGDVAAAIAETQRMHKPRLIALAEPGCPADDPRHPEVLVLPRGMELRSTKPFLDEWRDRPRARSGTMVARDLAAFIGFVERFKHPDTTQIFAADDLAKALALEAVFDWHPPGGDPHDARFARHRAHYAFPWSREWKEWARICAGAVEQADLADFLERRIDDVLPPPLTMDGATGETRLDLRDGEILKLVSKLGKRLATPAELVQMSRAFAVSGEQKVETRIDRDTGEARMVFEDQHAVRVPNLFLIAIPVIHNGPAFVCAVHLRYRRGPNKILWLLELHQPERIVETVFAEALAEVEKATGLKPLRGAPEIGAAPPAGGPK